MSGLDGRPYTEHIITYISYYSKLGKYSMQEFSE
jgi:hypothetical protein